jgi:hypothetical protein
LACAFCFLLRVGLVSRWMGMSVCLAYAALVQSALELLGCVFS